MGRHGRRAFRLVHRRGPAAGEWTASNTGVFPVTPGPRIFSLRLDFNSATSSVNCYGTVTARFILYGVTGSPTSPGITKNKMLAPPQH